MSASQPTNALAAKSNETAATAVLKLEQLRAQVGPRQFNRAAFLQALRGRNRGQRADRLSTKREMKLRPLHDRVVVKRLEQETKTASGIVIPDAAAEKPDQGEVLAVGPGKRNDKGDFVVLNVKVGDRVLFGKYSGQTVKVDGDELLVMREEDLFAVVEK
jgi:chaperonin GroES